MSAAIVAEASARHEQAIAGVVHFIAQIAVGTEIADFYALVGNAFVGLAEFAVSQLALVVNQPVGAVGAIGYVVVGYGTLVNRSFLQGLFGVHGHDERTGKELGMPF